MNPRFALAASTALLVILSGCDGPGNAVATAAETNAEFEAFVKATTRKSAAELTGDNLQEAIDTYIGMRVAAEAGIKAGVDKDPEVRGQMALSRDNVLSESLLQRYLTEHPITDADIQAEYDNQVATTPPEYSARHILVDDKALAEAIIQKLQAGGDFAALAKEYSKDGSAQNGGDLGWFNAQQMVPPFADAVAKLEKGKFSQTPVETQFGWHVIQLDDMRAASLPPLDQVKDRVKQLIQRKMIAAHLEELRKASTIDIDKLTADLTAYAATPKEPVAPAPAPAGTTPAEPAAPAEKAATP
jgi:peptidyl-prolyl cis-trans isomerase C